MPDCISVLINDKTVVEIKTEIARSDKMLELIFPDKVKILKFF